MRLHNTREMLANVALAIARPTRPLQRIHTTASAKRASLTTGSPLQKMPVPCAHAALLARHALRFSQARNWKLSPCQRGTIDRRAPALIFGGVPMLRLVVQVIPLVKQAGLGAAAVFIQIGAAPTRAMQPIAATLTPPFTTQVMNSVTQT